MAKLSLTFAAVSFIISLIASTKAQDTCVMTPNACQCAPSTPSGTCLRSQGDGTCLLGLCQEGYRCDCFGYELCGVSTCGKHISIGNTVPSETVPFQCKYSPGSGKCTNPVEILDTVNGAVNAETDAAVTTDETTTDEIDSTKEIEEIQKEKKALSTILKEVERVADDLPDEELEEIDVEAEIVEDAVEEAAEVALEAIKESKKAAKALREARGLKREARRADRMAKQKKEQLDVEEKKPKKNKPLCDKIRGEVDELTKKQKRASKGCGQKAKDARTYKKNCQQKRSKCKDIKKKAQDAGSRCMQKAEKGIGKGKDRKNRQ